MKSAYEIAMEKMKAASGPQKKLSEAQKKRVAEIEKKYAARVAETKLSFDARIAGAPPEEREKIQADLVSEIARLEEKLGIEKDKVWNEAKA
jgi:hypothetical protein